MKKPCILLVILALLTVATPSNLKGDCQYGEWGPCIDFMSSYCACVFFAVTVWCSDNCLLFEECREKIYQCSTYAHSCEGCSFESDWNNCIDRCI